MKEPWQSGNDTPEEKAAAGEPEQRVPIDEESSVRRGTRGATFGFADMWGNYMTACLLLILRSWSTYGYELQKRLADFGLPKIDYGTLYRTLRHLEKKGFVTSGWDTTAKQGLPRRIYSLTATGEAFLENWAGALEQYRRNLDFFFGFYGEKFQPGSTSSAEEDELAAAVMAAEEAAENDQRPAPLTTSNTLHTPTGEGSVEGEEPQAVEKPGKAIHQGRRGKTR